MRILVTGGEGFIGSNLISRLSKENHSVVSLDWNCNNETRTTGVEYVNRDMCDDLSDLFSQGFDVIYHMASEVGSGLSMADPKQFISANCLGTANILEAARNANNFPKIVLASSATVYGEATYECEEHGIQYPEFREDEQLKSKQWELECPICKQSMHAIGITEDRPLNPASIYGETKLSQERICSLIGRAWGFDTVALRLFGVFGPGQSLGNPYTGVLAFFSTLALAGIDIEHYEDGGQLKGYTYITDVVEAFVSAGKMDLPGFHVLNIGLTQPESIKDICRLIKEKLNSDIKYFSLGGYRVSDTRHSWPDTSKAKRVLNWQAKTDFETGLNELLHWMQNLPASEINSSLRRFKSAQAHALEMGLPL